jgi:8-oxo-dGTP pyrophosphatase MutT (NUDIX family)
MLKTEPAAISSAEFFDRSRARLRFDVPPGLIDPNIIPKSGDHGTDRMLEIIAREQPVRPAAVLIPVVDHPQPTVLLTQRSAHLNDHAGQIAFPGGKIDATDASPLDAALREAEEEVGLKREFVEPIGYLDLYATGFGFRILPTVARVKPGFKLSVNRGEVDDAFEVPLAFLMDPANHQLHSKEFRGMERWYYAMPFAERYIWGATAGILRVLYERICLT